MDNIVYRTPNPALQPKWDHIDADIDRMFGERITEKRKALGTLKNDHLKGKRHKQHGVGQGSRRTAAIREFTAISLSDGTLVGKAA